MQNEFDGRLRKIEDRLAELESKFVTSSSLALSSDFNKSTPSVRSKPTLLSYASDLSKNSSPPIAIESLPFSVWFKENWLVTVGVFLILLAGSWFISYAFANNWLGEKTRVLLEFISGATIYLIGFLLLRKQPKGGQALIILGEVIILLSFFTAYQAAILFPFQTFLLMLIAVNLTAIIAIKHNMEGIAISSIVFAAITPFLLDIEYSPIFFLWYALLINTAALWMLIVRGWGKTFHIAWMATFIYSMFFVQIDEQIVISFFMWAFYLTFFLPIVFPIYRKQLPALPLEGTFILISLNLVFIFWVNYFLTYPWNALSMVTTALLSSTLGYFIAKNWDQITPINSKAKYVLGAITGLFAMALTFLATDVFTDHFLVHPVSLDARIFLYLVEVVGAISMSYFIFQSFTAAIYLSLAFANPIFLLWDSFSSFLYSSFYSLQFAILCFAIFSLFTAARVNQRALLYLKLPSFLQKVLVNCLWIMASILSMIFIWNICHQIISLNNVAKGIALVVYIIIAEILIYKGNLGQLEHFRIGGVAIILFVIFRLLIEEVWEMPIIERMITFAAIGLLLVATAFFDKKQKKISV